FTLANFTLANFTLANFTLANFTLANFTFANFYNSKNKKPSRSWVFEILDNVNINVLRTVDAYALS
ncbi:pentapeptide repeat-containing protein, partial [Pseudoalteromonas neustonica]|uniref:pentapeptide repeat-containing protein n=2 Tax=Pseudoalteromonas TaxID=53246 RepID=UPI0016454DC7